MAYPPFSHSSSEIRCLCFGFLRGTIGREGLTVPTRSRAMARTSLGWSKTGRLGLFVRFFIGDRVLDSCTRRPYVAINRPDGTSGHFARRPAFVRRQEDSGTGQG